MGFFEGSNGDGLVPKKYWFVLAGYFKSERVKHRPIGVLPLFSLFFLFVAVFLKLFLSD